MRRSVVSKDVAPLATLLQTRVDAAALGDVAPLFKDLAAWSPEQLWRVIAFLCDEACAGGVLREVISPSPSLPLSIRLGSL